MKINKLKLILSSLANLLPMFFGIAVSEKLPDTMPIHWNINGEVDGYASKAVVIFVAPILLLILHLGCIFATKADNKNKEQNEKVTSIIYFIIPVVSIVVNGIIYSTVLGYNINVATVAFLLLGVLFLCLGNYMPKTKQNRTIGIKIFWTLRSEENWNRTHRFAGWLWFLLGFLLIILAFIPSDVTYVISGVALFLAAAAPFVYSYIMYKKEKSDK
ncbi:MAG: SdpI family protein [Clostridia bacterium]|nr:SdpI family protein [Clostridia bacterium]